MLYPADTNASKNFKQSVVKVHMSTYYVLTSDLISQIMSQTFLIF